MIIRRARSSPVFTGVLIGWAAFAASACDDEPDGSARSGVQSTSDGSGGAGGATSSGREPGGACDAASKEVKVSENISKDTTWECGTYLLQKLIFVNGDSTLTIKPGVHVLGESSAGEVSALIVTRGSSLDAVGTKESPIVFSSGNVEGARSPGDWGGLVILGKATVNTGACREGQGDACDGGYFEDNVNGLDPTDPGSVYGGRDDSWNCGHLEYARIEFAGYQLSPDNELNGLSVGACGTDTQLRYIQVHLGADDAIEFFGGTAGIDHALVTGGADDGLDWDYGWRGDAQFVIVHQRSSGGDRGVEGDNLALNPAASPRARPRLYNFTLLGNPSRTGIALRSGTQGEMRNFLVQGFQSAVDVDAAGGWVAADWPETLTIESSVFHHNLYAGDPDEMDDDAGFNEDELLRAPERKNVFDVDPELAPELDRPNYKPASRSLGGRATPPNGFDTRATYAGAVDPDGTDWTQGWTNHRPD